MHSTQKRYKYGIREIIKTYHPNIADQVVRHDFDGNTQKPWKPVNEYFGKQLRPW